MGKRMKQGKRRLLAACVLLVMVIGAYLSIGYDASPEAIDAMAAGSHDGYAQVFMPQEVRGGLIFYPGGLVDHRAYAPLMRLLCDRGILCLLMEMPMDLAVLNVRAADGHQARYPQVERWLIGGHSLGGAMAASYVSDHADEYDALVLLGAYSTADLSRTDLRVLSIYGTQDGVLNREKYESCRGHYPPRFEEIVVDGGCHAYFGDYGTQKGDGTPSISREAQMTVAADAIAAMME